MARIIDYEAQNIIGGKLREYRLERHLSQKELAERLETYAIYVCRGSISRIETMNAQLRTLNCVLWQRFWRLML